MEQPSFVRHASGDAKEGARMSTGVDDTRYRDDAVYGKDGRRANATTRGVAPRLLAGLSLYLLMGGSSKDYQSGAYWVLERIVSRAVAWVHEGIVCKLLIGSLEGLSLECCFWQRRMTCC
jgi:hypothetical protein